MNPEPIDPERPLKPRAKRRVDPKRLAACKARNRIRRLLSRITGLPWTVERWTITEQESDDGQRRECVVVNAKPYLRDFSVMGTPARVGTPLSERYGDTNDMHRLGLLLFGKLPAIWRDARGFMIHPHQFEPVIARLEAARNLQEDAESLGLDVAREIAERPEGALEDLTLAMGMKDMVEKQNAGKG